MEAATGEKAPFDCNRQSRQVFLIFKVTYNYVFMHTTQCAYEKHGSYGCISLGLGTGCDLPPEHTHSLPVPLHGPQPCLNSSLLEVIAFLNLPAGTITWRASQPTPPNPYSLAKVYSMVQPIIFKCKPQEAEVANCACAYVCAAFTSSRAQEGGHQPLSRLWWI